MSTGLRRQAYGLDTGLDGKDQEKLQNMLNSFVQIGGIFYKKCLNNKLCINLLLGIKIKLRRSLVLRGNQVLIYDHHEPVGRP